ncbi:MAG: nucleotidyltransferase domain-containing protein [Hyphomonadaceae bacterium]|nr:nucleotidyltransferase domain-containing protein [Hyphomonadaceae bacterium]
MSEDLPVSEDARADIVARLDALARERGVRMLLAVESGSRAWGFHSPDSDYDVRFLYVHAADAYLSLFPPRDVIETPIEGLIDLNGWDLGKALKLMIRGNSVVHEWLASPIRYCADEAFLAALAPVARAWRSTYADAYHYYGLLQSQWARFIEGRERVKLKKYFYVIRPAIALAWLREKPDAAPPMDLPGLLRGVALPRETFQALEALRVAKRDASEIGEGARIPALDAYVRAQAEWGLSVKGKAPKPEKQLLEETDAFFRKVVRG